MKTLPYVFIFVIFFNFFTSFESHAQNKKLKLFKPIDLIEAVQDKNTKKSLYCARKNAKGRLLPGLIKKRKTGEMFLSYQTQIARIKFRITKNPHRRTALEKRLAKVQKNTKAFNRICKQMTSALNSLYFLDSPQVKDLGPNSMVIAFMTSFETIAEIKYGTSHHNHNDGDTQPNENHEGHNHHDHMHVNHGEDHENRDQRTITSSEYSSLHEIQISNLYAGTVYHIDIFATDKKGNKIDFHLHAVTPDGEPIPLNLSGMGHIRVRVGQTVQVDVDPAADSLPVTFNLQTSASFATLDELENGKARLTVAPTQTGQVGVYPSKLIVTDGQGLTDEAEFRIEVYPAIPPEPLPGEPGFFISEHHDPFIPNFGHVNNTSTLNLSRVETISNGNWSSLYSALPCSSVLVIKHTITYDVNNGCADSIVIYPGGALKFRNNINTKLNIVTIQVMRGGLLEIGTPSAPVAGNVTSEIIFKNKPINNLVDPAQYGNGLINFGEVYLHGKLIQNTFSRSTKELNAGDTIIELENNVSDWRPGDKLIFPDTHQVRSTNNNPYLMKWEENEVQSVNLNRVTLVRPLANNHPAGRDIDGNIDFYPYVANLTRNVKLRSENPNGVRAHSANFGRAYADIRYVSFEAMGRTFALNPNIDMSLSQNKYVSHIDNTVLQAGGIPAHIGNNQEGRYSLHFHHYIGPRQRPASGFQFVTEGNALEDSPKWAIVVHGSHYGKVSKNVIYRSRGAGIVMENGSETGNVIENNFVMASVGAGTSALQRGRSDFGHEGAGFWSMGSGFENLVRNNVFANNTLGSNLVHLFLPNQVRYPLTQGDDPHMNGQYLLDPSPRRQQPRFENNEAFSNTSAGFEVWTLASRLSEPSNQNPQGALPSGIPELKNLKAWHNQRGGIIAGSGQPNTFFVNGLKVRQALIGDNQLCIGTGISSTSAYTSYIRVNNADIQGTEVGLRDTKAGYIVENSFLRNCTNFLPFKVLGRNYYFNNVKHSPLPGKDFRGVIFQTSHLTPGSSRTGEFSSSSAYLSRFIIQNHQQIPGNDYEVFLSQQLPNHSPLIAKGESGVLAGCPEQNLTSSQCFERYGYAIAGQLARCTGPLAEGIVAGATCANPPLDITYHPTPRAYLTAATVIPGRARVTGVITGDPAKMNQSNSYMIQLANNAPREINLQDPLNRYIDFSYRNLTPGEYTVNVWLRSPNGNELPQSRDTINFTVFATE